MNHHHDEPPKEGFASFEPEGNSMANDNLEVVLPSSTVDGDRPPLGPYSHAFSPEELEEAFLQLQQTQTRIDAAHVVPGPHLETIPSARISTDGTSGFQLHPDK